MATKKEGVKAKTGLDLQRQRDAKFATLSSDVEVARRRAGKIRDGLRSWTATRDAIIEAFQKQDWFTLGYTSWDDYCDTEFSGSKLNLSDDDRREAILAFASVGMTLREIGSAAGTSKDTASRVLKASRVSDETKSPLVEAVRGEIEAAAERTETSGAAPPASTEDASPVLGEPDVDEQAASTSGTPDPLSPIGRAIATAPAGSAHGAPDFRDDDTDSPAADPLSDSSSHAGVPAVGGQIHEQENGWSGPNGDCGVSCTCGVMFDGFDTIGEARALLDLHIANPEERDEEEAAEPPADLPAAATTSLPDGDGDPTPEPEQQPGHNSPTGLEAAQPREGRSETDHQQDAGVSSPAGEAPEVASTDPVEPVELEGGGTAQEPPSSSDPDDEDEPRPIDLVLMTSEALIKLLDHVDVEAAAPLLFPAELENLHQHSEALAAFVAKVSRIRFEALTRTP